MFKVQLEFKVVATDDGEFFQFIKSSHQTNFNDCTTSTVKENAVDLKQLFNEISIEELIEVFEDVKFAVSGDISITDSNGTLIDNGSATIITDYGDYDGECMDIISLFSLKKAYSDLFLIRESSQGNETDRIELRKLSTRSSVGTKVTIDFECDLSKTYP